MDCQPSASTSLRRRYRGTHGDSGVRPHRDRRRPRRRERRRPGERRAACRSSSSRANWSAASARTGRACRRRRCCEAARRCARARDVDGARQAVTGSRRRGRGPPPTRRDRPRLERRVAGRVAARGRDRPRARPRPADRRAAGDASRAPTASRSRSSARHAVAVSTGSAALLPDIPGLKDAEPWTSRDATGVQRRAGVPGDPRRRGRRQRDGDALRVVRRAR